MSQEVLLKLKFNQNDSKEDTINLTLIRQMQASSNSYNLNEEESQLKIINFHDFENWYQLEITSNIKSL